MIERKIQKYAISAGHAVTLEAAETALNNGGNAFDAAFVAGFTMFISEPGMSSAGAGGFAMCMEKGAEPVVIDFFVQSPISKAVSDLNFYPIEVDFGHERETFHVGHGSSATPGIIKGLFDMHSRYGSLPVNELLEIPMQYAKSGVKVDTFQSIELELLRNIFGLDETVRDVFFRDGKIITEGHELNMPYFPDFIQLMMDEGVDGFYKGPISAIIAKVHKEQGGYLRRKDFEQYESFWRKPYKQKNKLGNLYVNPLPSLGGALSLLFLDEYPKQKNNWVDALYEIKSNFKTSQEIIEEISKRFDDIDVGKLGTSQAPKGTSHFNIVDAYGHAVSFTCSIGEGSGFFIPGTNMQMNNMMGEDYLLPTGFHSWEANTRLHSMMSPCMITDNELELLFAGGSGGASRIPVVLSQVIQNVILGKTNLENIIKNPRVVVQESMIHYEKGFDLDGTKLQRPHREWDTKSLFFGGVHAILKTGGNTSAVGDFRRYGVSKVWE